MSEMRGDERIDTGLALVRHTGMIVRCQHVIASVGSGIRIAFRRSDRVRPSSESSVIRRVGSSRSRGAQKNTLRSVWASAPALVRSEDASGAGSLLWRSPDPLGWRDPTRAPRALWDGEAGAPGLPGRLAVLYETLCLLRRAAVSRLDDPGRRPRAASESEDGQDARDAVHGGPVATRRHARARAGRG